MAKGKHQVRTRMSGRDIDAAKARRLHRRAIDLILRFRFSSALVASSRALAILSRLPGARLETPIVLNTIGEIHADRGDHVNAIRCYVRSLRVLQRQTLRSSGRRTRLRAALGLMEALRSRGRYSESEAVGTCALAEAEGSFGEEAMETAGALNALGVLYKYMGRFSEAFPLYRRALAIARREVGPGSEAVATLYHNLGGLEHARRDPARGEPHARRALRIRRRLLGRNHPRVAADAVALGAILDARGERAEAERLYRGALAVFERTLGSEHYEVAVTINNLATLLQSNGMLDEAERLHRRALELKSRLLGVDHPDVALTLNNLALLCRAAGRPREAHRLYSQAFRIARRALGRDHPTLLILLRNHEALLRSERKAGLARRARARVDGLRPRLRGGPPRSPAAPDVAGGLRPLFRIAIRRSPSPRIGVYAMDPVPPRRKVIEHVGFRPGPAGARAGPLDLLSISLEHCSIDGRRAAACLAHSSHPNLRPVRRRGSTVYMSTRRIHAGEELSLDRSPIGPAPKRPHRSLPGTKPAR